VEDFTRLPTKGWKQGSYKISGVYMFLCNGRPMYCGESRMLGRRVYQHLWQLKKDGCVFAGSSGNTTRLTDSFIDSDWEVVVWCRNSAERKLLEFKLHLKYKSLKGTGTSGMNGFGHMITYRGTTNYVWNLYAYVEKYKLNKGNMYSVVNGKRKQHKGRTARSATYSEAKNYIGV
jgi:hypothetical protein